MEYLPPSQIFRFQVSTPSLLHQTLYLMNNMPPVSPVLVTNGALCHHIEGVLAKLFFSGTDGFLIGLWFSKHLFFWLGAKQGVTL